MEVSTTELRNLLRDETKPVSPWDPTYPDGVYIVVLQRGWVCVGHVSQSGSRVTIERARIIRKWGTTKGLAQLRAGPLPDTVLDDGGTIIVHELAIIQAIQCEASKWNL